MERRVVFHSGGAIGADTAFLKNSLNSSLDVFTVIHSFSGHKPVILKNQEKFKVEIHYNLAEANEFVRKASIFLKRRIPSEDYSKNLIRRNYFQIRDSELVFAVAPLETDRTVSGGTGWAVAMAVERKIPVFVFDDLNSYNWFYFSYFKKSFQFWRNNLPLNFLSFKVEKGFSIFTGIGTRKLSLRGNEEIRRIFT